MLEVVHHEQQAPVTEKAAQLNLRRAPTGVLETKSPDDGRRDQGRIANRRQRHEEDTVNKVVRDVPGQGERQASLPTPTRTGERQETNVLSPELLTRQRQVSLAPDQRVTDEREIRSDPARRRRGVRS